MRASAASICCSSTKSCRASAARNSSPALRDAVSSGCDSGPSTSGGRAPARSPYSPCSVACNSRRRSRSLCCNSMSSEEVRVIMDRFDVICNATHNGGIAKAFRQIACLPNKYLTRARFEFDWHASSIGFAKQQYRPVVSEAVRDAPIWGRDGMR
ncbi:conserved exported hypothetical protein [Paraburkholderia piptadeniae]|uniref:Uncharacterized protein n=1 Tax=Paraburkholderia piptadeniae TaxID=1701573 RepID=A0A1N7SNM5_9BURK|nr:conserved exported hypothetical protein [Paraburkholderia piptadeniae]